MCKQLKRNIVAVRERGDFVLAVQEILRIDIPKL
jgi:hypothetical protein